MKKKGYNKVELASYLSASAVYRRYNGEFKKR